MVSRLHALIIGINEYMGREFTNLKGAVADADRMQRFLHEELGVSLKSIRNLRNKDATRNAILTELRNFTSNEAIIPDDPILIYFAGHGTQGPTPSSWPSEDGHIQMLIPHDYGSVVNNKEIEGIPDRTLSFILTEIANEKGDNITVILDCCHSGSGTRSSDSEVLTRGINRGKKPIPKELDQEIWMSKKMTRGLKVSETLRHHGLQSHVLLAACTAQERAQEISGRGVFTNALLTTLSGLNIEETTYIELMQRMDALPQQNPQCEGRYQNRAIFNAKIRSIKACYDVHRKNGDLVISAGIVHGVDIGSKFALWESRDALRDYESLADVKINKVSAFESFAPFPELAKKRSMTPAIALLIGSINKPNLRLHIPPHIMDLEVMRKTLMKAAESNSRLSVLLCNKEMADVGLVDLNGRIGFNVLNPQERYLRSGANSIKCEINYNTDEICEAWSRMAHFEYHLRRTNANPPRFSGIPFRTMFTLDVFCVEADENGNYSPVGSNLNISGVGVEVCVDPNVETHYGFKITNESNFQIYPALFYFNTWEFSIQPLYLPGSAVKGKVDPPLKVGQYLPIGYGSGGASPQLMSVSSPSGIEVGFLKLFVTTQYVDFSNIAQYPIMENFRSMRQAPPRKTEFWDTVLVPFNLRQSVGQRTTHMIAIMGYQGTGKASFIDDILKSVGLPNLTPTFENKYIKEYDIILRDGFIISIVDLPGFESIADLSSNLDILKYVVGYLGKQYQRNRLFHGFIYTHNITKPRVGPLDHLNMMLARNLCGLEAMKIAVVVTTCWDQGTDITSYISREEGLKGGRSYFKAFQDAGASFRRYGKFSQTCELAQYSALSILSDPDLVNRSIMLPLAVQVEAKMAKNLVGTTAGADLCNKIKQLITQKKAELKDLKDEMQSANNEELKGLQEEEVELSNDIKVWGQNLEDCGTIRLV